MSQRIVRLLYDTKYIRRRQQLMTICYFIIWYIDPINLILEYRRNLEFWLSEQFWSYEKKWMIIKFKSFKSVSNFTLGENNIWWWHLETEISTYHWKLKWSFSRTHYTWFKTGLNLLFCAYIFVLSTKDDNL